MKKFKVIGCKVLMKELYSLALESENIIDIMWLKQELHNTPNKLQAQINEAIKKIEDEEENYDAIILGYGLCSNGIVGVRCIDTPIIVPRGHDCITMLLGSKERYKEIFDEHDGGIYWYSAGWIDHTLQPGKERYEKTYQEYVDKFGEDNAKYLMDMEQNWMQEYNCALFVKWDELDEEKNKRYSEYTKKCAKYLEWEYRLENGSSNLLQSLLNGIWNEERFLSVEPGMMIVATNDESIIGTKPYEKE